MVTPGKGLQWTAFGTPFWVYHSLPYSLLAVRNPLVVLDWSTNCYHPPDLGQTLPRATFTNLYRRDGGLGDTEHIVTSGLHPAWWATVIRVDNVENGRTHSECVGTMVVGVEKKKEKNLTTVA